MTDMNADALTREAVANAVVTAGTARKRLVAMTAEQLLATEFPPREMLLGPWLPLKGLAMIYGRRGLGKTHVALGIAWAVATGGEFLRWRAPAARRVVILDGEMSGESLQARLAEIAGDTAGEALGRIRVIAADLQERSINLAEAADQRELEPHLAGTDLVIVDNISTLAPYGRENEAESWQPVQTWGLAQRRAGRTVLFIHHAGKDGAQRGTSRREDVLDSVLALREPPDYLPAQGARFCVHFEKARGFHGRDAEPFEAAFGPGGWTTRDLSDADAERAATLRGEGLSVREIAEAMGTSKSRVDRMLRRAEDKAGRTLAGRTMAEMARPAVPTP